MIQIEKLTAVIAKTVILRDISCSIREGEFIALVGPNGAGKTTLLKHLNGLLKPTSGSVSVNGLDTRKTKTSALARSVGFLFQNPDQQILCPTVREELQFGLRYCGVPKPEWEERVAAAAGAVDLGERLDADPLMLTRSRRQRVALASVLATGPRILILDEPTSAQDEAETTNIMEIARAMVAEGKTVILVSHDMELVARYATRALVLVDGRLEADLPVRELFRNAALLDLAHLERPGAYRIAHELSLEIDDYSIHSLARALESRAVEAV